MIPSIQIWIEPELPSDWPADGMGPLAVLVAQIPASSAVPRGAWVAVRASRASSTRFFSWWFRKPAGAHLALRCTALLAKGYERIGGGLDAQGAEIAWGRAPEEGSGILYYCI